VFCGTWLKLCGAKFSHYFLLKWDFFLNFMILFLQKPLGSEFLTKNGLIDFFDTAFL
jgi:hypothetical protein